MSIIVKHEPTHIIQLSDCPVGMLWLLQKLEGNKNFSHRFNPLFKAMFPRWISAQHNTIDLTPIFSVRGTKLYKSIIDVLVNGEIYPISHGYVFCMDRPSAQVGMEHVMKTHLVFVSTQDKRLDGIKAMRLRMIDPVLQQAYNQVMPIPLDDLLAIANLHIEDFADMSHDNSDYRQTNGYQTNGKKEV